MNSSVTSLTTVSSNQGTMVTSENFSFPITVDFVYPVSSAYYGFTVTTTQKYRDSKLVLANGHLADFSSVANTATATDVSPASSSQQYTAVSLKGKPYNCTVASTNNVLSSVSSGCN